MDTEKQRQCRCDDVRLTESGNPRSEQLNTCGAYRVTNQQSLAYLSGSERRRPSWFLDMKYQTCFWKIADLYEEEQPFCQVESDRYGNFNSGAGLSKKGGFYLEKRFDRAQFHLFTGSMYQTNLCWTLLWNTLLCQNWTRWSLPLLQMFDLFFTGSWIVTFWWCVENFIFIHKSIASLRLSDIFSGVILGWNSKRWTTHCQT